MTEGTTARAGRLCEAARLVDALGSTLGTRATATADGDLLRDLAADEVRLAHSPLVFRIQDETFAPAGVQVPVATGETLRQFRLYWLCAPISLFPARNWGFDKLDVHVEFNRDAVAEQRRPVALDVLPGQEIEQVVDVSGQIDVSVDPSARFRLATPNVDLTPVGVPVEAAASVAASASAGIHATLGPFRYRVTRTRVSHTPIGMEYVHWRIDDVAHLEKAGPSLVVLLAVPRSVDAVVIHAQMEASRYFKFASAPLLEKIRQLPSRLRDFLLDDGAPVPDATIWDITALL